MVQRSSASSVTSFTGSPMTRRSRLSTSSTTWLRLSERWASGWRRAKARSWRTRARRAGTAARSPRGRSAPCGPPEVEPGEAAALWMPVRTLLKSCATPPASMPTVSIFWVRCSASRRLRSVTSRTLTTRSLIASGTLGHRQLEVNHGPVAAPGLAGAAALPHVALEARWSSSSAGRPTVSAPAPEDALRRGFMDTRARRR
jgi:hypothetical protein